MIDPLFIKSIIIGFLAAFPIWPAGMFCLKRGFTHGKYSSLISGFGISSANILGIFISICCLQIVTSLIENQQAAHIGTGLLIAAGLYGILQDMKTSKKHYARYITRLGVFLFSFISVILNPMTYALFLAMLTIFKIDYYNMTLTSVLKITIGTGIGSALLWIIMSNHIYYIKSIFEDIAGRKINYAAHLLIAIIGIGLLLSH